MDPEEIEESEIVVVDPGDTVLVSEAEPVEPVDGETDPVIVNVDVEAPADDADALDAVVVATELSLVERVTRIEERLTDVENRSYTAEWKAEDALAAVEQTEEVVADVAEATDDAVEELEDAEITDEDKDGDLDVVVDDPIQPVSNKVHPFFRTRADWKDK